MSVLKIRNWKLVKTDYQPDDMHNCIVESWAGEYDVCSPFSIQFDETNLTYRFCPCDGSQCKYSEWRDSNAIDQILDESVTSFEWGLDF